MSMAKTYSRTFERLSRRLLSEQLNLPEDAIHLTPASSDGGLDGKGVISIGVILGEGIGYNFAFEAKLRGEEYDAGLDVFAKAMVVAFNAGHHGLALTTNRLFTPQCVAEAARFRIRTGLRFLYVDGPRISRWTRTHFDQLLTEGYPRTFLMGLLWANEDQAFRDYEKREIVIPMDFAGQHVARVTFEGHGGADAPLIGSVETCARVLPPPPIDLLGTVRNKVFRDLRTSVESVSGGLHVLWGDAGVGKSVLVRHIGQEREAANWVVTSLDLRQASTARELFLKVLVPLLGTDLSAALSEVGQENAGDLLRTLVDEGLPNADLDAVAAVLSRSHDSHRARSDLDHAVLLTVLGKVIERRGSRGTTSPRQLLILEEVTYSPPEVLDFLAKLLPVLSDGGVSILMEARFSDLASDREKHWRAFKNVVLTCATSQYALPPFERDDALAYVQRLLPGIGPERANVIVTRVGTTPLFLETAAEYLIRKRAVLTHADGRHVTVEDVEVFFEGIVPEKAHLLIGLQVKYWATRQQKLLLAAALLDGNVPLAAAEALVAADEVDAFLDGAVKTRLFEASTHLDKVVAKHGLIIDALEAYASENRFATRRIAQTLLEVVPQLEPDALRRQALSAVLSEAAGLVEEAVGLAHAAGLAFLQQHQLEQADRYLAIADRLCAKIEPEFPERRCRILLDLLELRDQRYLLGSERSAAALQNARFLWAGAGDLSPPTDANARELRLRAGYVLWRAEHTRENFSSAENLGRALMESVSAACDGPSEVVGSALSALGITLKALGKPKESREAFADAMAKASESRSLRVQCHSNEAALCLADAPEDALAHYDAILEMTTANGPLFLPHLHAQVDRAMALFLMRDDDAAFTQARRAEQMASSNGVAAQTARALNIIGCLVWGGGDVAAAHGCFQQAVLDAERSYSDRFLWRMRTNLAATALDLGLEDEAVSNASSAAHRILSSRSGHWPSPDKLRTARWYHALIQCSAVLWKLNRQDEVLAWGGDVKAGDFLDQVHSLANGAPTTDLTGIAGSLHSGRIMITG